MANKSQARRTAAPGDGEKRGGYTSPSKPPVALPKVPAGPAPGAKPSNPPAGKST